MTSDADADARDRLADPLARASALGGRLAALTDEPDVFVRALEDGLADLSDPAHAVTLRRVSPDVDSPYAVRAPLVRAIEAPLRVALRDSSSSTALSLAAHLERSDVREVRMFARSCLLRALSDEPERSWQLMRRLGTRASDWIEVDALALPWAVGVLAEAFRWAELEQLVYSRNVMERRLVGATLATMPHALTRAARSERGSELAPRAIELVAALIGDDEPMVQKALAWALRSWHPLAADAVEMFLRQQAGIASTEADGHRAWVVRETLPALPPSIAIELRDRLHDVRRRSGAPSSSVAAATAARYGFGAGSLVAADQGERYARSHR